MRRRIILTICALTLLVVWLSYTSCGQPSTFQKVQGNSSTAGNPLAPTTNAILNAVCTTITRCDQQVTLDKCLSGVLNLTGLGVTLGLPSTFSGSYSSLITDEQNGVITAGTGSTTCVTDINNLSCSSTQVQGAYDPNNTSNPFAGVSSMIPTGTSSCASAVQVTHNVWTFVSGSNTVNQKTLTAAPGARHQAATARDKNGVVWMFGGQGYDFNGASGKLSDLWKFDGSVWTMVSGSQTINSQGNYGTKGVAAATNAPGARSEGVMLADSQGRLWLFGGVGYTPSNTTLKTLNDLWMYNPATNQWTWMSGTINAPVGGTYGTLGVSAASNVPGSRIGMVAWIDSSDHLWIFGGGGNDSASAYGNLNDLWMWDGANWTWKSGSNLIGAANSGLVPGARIYATGWKDNSGAFWLFGGATNGDFNDLWKFDGANWTHVAGPLTQNSFSTATFPGARYTALTVSDGAGGAWLFGGVGYDTGSAGNLNDLWKFDGSAWTKITQSPPQPGVRGGDSGWLDASGKLWIFGGSSSGGDLNDLWYYTP